MLNSFNRKLELKDTECTIKNKLKKILTKLRGFKFVATLVFKKSLKTLEFKKIESHNETKYDTFY